jgi:hypothetical protein
LGWNDNDLDKFILDHMWQMLARGKVRETENEEDAKENVEEEVAKDKKPSYIAECPDASPL